MTNSFLFDKLLPFSKRGYVDAFNLFQIYIIRYGIGYYISKKICFFAGTHISIILNNYKENDLNENIREIFIKAQNSLDEILNKKMLITLQENINLYSYKGNMYMHYLPINGQRRKSNSNTIKRVRQIKK